MQAFGFDERIFRRLFARGAVRAMGRFVLACLVLALGAAIASPGLQHGSLQIVCSGIGPVRLVMTDNGGDVHDVGAAQLDCPLCMPGGAPPPQSPTPPAAPAVQPLGRIVQSIPAARLAAAIAAPLPPRGPPALL